MAKNNKVFDGDSAIGNAELLSATTWRFNPTNGLNLKWKMTSSHSNALLLATILKNNQTSKNQ